MLLAVEGSRPEAWKETLKLKSEKRWSCPKTVDRTRVTRRFKDLPARVSLLSAVSMNSPSKRKRPSLVAKDEEFSENGSHEPESTSPSGAQMQTKRKEEDKYLPVANIARIMKNQMTKDTKLAGEAKEMMQMFLSEFIAVVVGEWVFLQNLQHFFLSPTHPLV